MIVSIVSFLNDYKEREIYEFEMDLKNFLFAL